MIWKNKKRNGDQIPDHIKQENQKQLIKMEQLNNNIRSAARNFMETLTEDIIDLTELTFEGTRQQNPKNVQKKIEKIESDFVPMIGDVAQGLATDLSAGNRDIPKEVFGSVFGDMVFALINVLAVETTGMMINLSHHQSKFSNFVRGNI